MKFFKTKYKVIESTTPDLEYYIRFRWWFSPFWFTAGGFDCAYSFKSKEEAIECIKRWQNPLKSIERVVCEL